MQSSFLKPIQDILCSASPEWLKILVGRSPFSNCVCFIKTPVVSNLAMPVLMQLVAKCLLFCPWRWGLMDKVAVHLVKLFSKTICFPIQVMTVPLLHHQWLAQHAHLICYEGTLGVLSHLNYLMWQLYNLLVWLTHTYIYFLPPVAVFRIAQLVQWLGYTLDDRPGFDSWQWKVSTLSGLALGHTMLTLSAIQSAAYLPCHCAYKGQITHIARGPVLWL